jgi:hypothetical protein
MRTHRVCSLLLVAWLGVILVTAAARAADAPKVLSVITVKVNGGRQPYLEKIKTFQAIAKRLKLPAARIWRGTLAGTATDQIFIATEYENLAALAAAQAKLAADPEATQFNREMDGSGMRTVLDRSLFVDDTPQ